MNTVGFVSGKDNVNIGFTKDQVLHNIQYLIDNDVRSIRTHFGLKDKDARDWTVPTAKKDAEIYWSKIPVTECTYRPFDNRFTFYTGQSRGLYSSPQKKVLKHLLNRKNIALVIGRQGQAVGSMQWNLIFTVKNIADFNLYYRGGIAVFPLYLFEDDNLFEGKGKGKPNLNIEIINQITSNLNYTYTNEKEQTPNTFAPIDILDYIYAVLHSPTYREKYKEFLKTDFPRVPYPTDADTFWALVKLGGELRQIHLLESPVVSKFITQYPVDGNNTVGKTKYEDGKVWINTAQYFDKVPKVAWEFYIGGYQPAQKWLKDRKNRQLSFDDILHYQKIIVALTETDRLMKEIDKLDFLE